VAETPGEASRGGKGLRKFLCGHDERHWFVAEVPRGTTVREAKEALKPAPSAPRRSATA
jgi:hypothetical protein